MPENDSSIRYDGSGRQVRLIGTSRQHQVVAPIVEDEYGERFDGPPELVGATFSSPPKERLDEEFERTMERVDRARELLSSINGEIRDAEAKREALFAALEEVPALEHLRHALSEEWTHFVRESYGRISVVGPDDTWGSDVESCYYKEHDYPLLRLVSTYQKRGPRRLEWRADTGARFEHDFVMPCMSEAVAREKAAEMILLSLQEKEPLFEDSLVHSAEALGVEVPLDVRKRRHEERVSVLRKVRDEAESGAKKARGELDQLVRNPPAE